MQEILINKLHGYIINNHPDLLISLQQEGKVNSYLQAKAASVTDLSDQLQAEGIPPYLIEEMCMDDMTKELRPSKFNYLCSILEEEFEKDYHQLKKTGLLDYEVLNMMTACAPGFEAIEFTEDKENDRHLRYLMTGMIQEYLDSKK